jgi:tetratricopeptide (TPR) repeat protein
MLRLALACLLIGVVHAGAQALPAVPTFELAPGEPGFATVRELRVDGAKRFDTEVKVRGYVIWIYDCVADVAKRGESRAKVQRRIDDDPTLCERPKLYLGTTKTDALEKGLWVVDVPRAPNKLERERLPKEELAAWPRPPKVKVGDYVTVRGKLTLRSPHNEVNSDGLVVFSAIEPAKPPKPVAIPSAFKPPSAPAVAEPTTKLVTPPAVSDAARQRSIKAANEATRLYTTHFTTQAIEMYEKAIQEWPGNHLAFYGLAGAHIADGNWRGARAAIEKALALAPKEPTYNMVLGYVLYEGAVAEAREAQAKQQGKSPADIHVDTTGIDHDTALRYLTYATKLDPKLWRAHYYIGRIHRDRGHAQWAAAALDAAVRAAPDDPNPWVALVELYRRWDYTEQAIAVATAATAAIPKAAAVWYVQGLALDDKLRFADAIAAYTKALELEPGHAKALFSRGQDYARTRDRKRAKVDLEAYLANTADGFAAQQASRMLMELP